MKLNAISPINILGLMNYNCPVFPFSFAFLCSAKKLLHRNLRQPDFQQAIQDEKGHK
jgi:hypothetical protein